MSGSIQLRLLRTDSVIPTPLSAEQYVPALQNRRGELNALRTVSQATWQYMRPLIQLVGPRDEPLTAEQIDRWMKNLAGAVGDHLVHLDVMRVDPAGLIDTGNGRTAILPFIYAAARSYDINFVPVAWVGESTREHIHYVAQAARQDGRGIVLRFRFLSVMPRPGQTRQSMLEALCRDLEGEASACDLVLDLGVLKPYDDMDPGLTAKSVNDVATVGPWRSLILLGSSVPETLDCIEEGTVSPLRRLEWDLWTELLSYDLPRVPVFGDYAVQNPRPPAAGGWSNMRASVRYTAGNKIFVARGTGPIKETGRGQYRDLCRQITELEEFLGPDYTEGDRIIDECARGLRALGQQTLWREAGTSHHLKYVTEQIRAEQTEVLQRVVGTSHRETHHR